MKICMVAPPSCDKTTTAREVVKLLKKKHRVNAEVAEEYARKYIRDNYDGEHPIKDPHQQYPITLGQIEVERTVGKMHEVVVCDSASFLGYIYANELVKSLPEDQRKRPMYMKILKDLHEIALKELPSYSLIFLFEPSDTVFKDGVRKENDDDRARLYKKIKGFLDAEGYPYIKLTGNAEEKADAVVKTVLSVRRIYKEDEWDIPSIGRKDEF